MTWHSVKRWGSSAFAILAGSATVLQGLQYPLGTLSAMGPGMFPVALGVLLVFLGVLTALMPEGAEDGEAAWPRFDIRGPACIVLALVLFIVVGRYAGLALASFVLIFLAALADRRNSPGAAAVLAVVVTAAGLFLFSQVLHGQLPLFPWS